MKGESFKWVFGVNIGNEESVSDLKKAIKAKRAQLFSNVDAASIVIWNVSIPYNSTLTDNVDKLRLGDPLLPVHKLSVIFSKPLIEQHAHIIIGPPPARSTTNEANLTEEDDIVMALKTSSFLPITTIRIIS